MKLKNMIKFKCKRFIKILKVAFHKSYMIKAILTMRCPHCKRWFSFPKIMEQNTRYHNDYNNYFCGCTYCHKENESYWDEMWKDYYSSIL